MSATMINDVDPRLPFEPETWTQPDGAPVSCIEKLKVLRENLDEIATLCQESLEDAVLMGCDEAQFRDTLVRMVASLENPYQRG